MAIPMAKIDELREHYDSTDTAADLEQAEFVPADAPPAAERMTTFAVRLPVPVLNRVRALAADAGLNTSDLIRQWLAAGLAAADESDRARQDEAVLPVSVLHDLIDVVAAAQLQKFADVMPRISAPKIDLAFLVGSEEALVASVGAVMRARTFDSLHAAAEAARKAIEEEEDRSTRSER